MIGSVMKEDGNTEQEGSVLMETVIAIPLLLVGVVIRLVPSREPSA